MPTMATASTTPPSTLGRFDQATHGLEQDQQREHEQRHAVGLGREDLDALEAVGHHALRRARGEPDRHQRERDRSRVGEHVPRVREQRERAGEQPGDDLDEHESEDQRERDCELAAVGVRRDAVRVSLVAPGRVGSHATFTDVTVGEGAPGDGGAGPPPPGPSADFTESTDALGRPTASRRRCPCARAPRWIQDPFPCVPE